jgi:hypothetical protein
MDNALEPTGRTSSRLGFRVIAVVASATMAIVLGGCTTEAVGPAPDGVSGTTWSGIDSLDRPTVFTFEPDGTVEVTYFDDTFNDERDTWSLDGSTITITVFVSEEEGSANYAGTVDLSGADDGPTAAMALEARVSDSGESFTLDLTRD